MSINEDQEWTSPSPETPLEVYASFSRKRGGLLYVLQAVLLIGQIIIAYTVCGKLRLWAPALLLPLFFVYFPFRNLMWERTYRPFGHLDTVDRRGQVRRSLLWLAILLAVAIGGFVGAQSALTNIVWLAVPLGALLLWGRLPADADFAFGNCFLILSLGYEYTGRIDFRTMLWLLIPCLAWAIRGVREHCLFLKNGKPTFR